MDGVQDRLDITAAAARLNLTVEAVRKRVKRGTLPAIKVDGRWYVVLPGTSRSSSFAVLDNVDNLSSPEPNTVQDSDLPGGQDGVQDAPTGTDRVYQQLVASLQDEVAFLRRQLEDRTEELRRKDHIIAAMTQRIPELPTGTDQTAPPSSWWSWIRARFAAASSTVF